MSRNLKTWIECEIHPSAYEIADVFWAMDAEEQAGFFNRLAEIADRLPFQLQSVTDSPHLTPAGRTVMCEIGSIGVSPVSRRAAMTTNNPEVVAWLNETWRSATESRPVVHDWEDNGIVVTPLVRLSDYETLQAENEQLRRGISALVEALERINGMDSMIYHSLESAKIVAAQPSTPTEKRGEP